MRIADKSAVCSTTHLCYLQAWSRAGQKEDYSSVVVAGKPMPCITWKIECCSFAYNPTPRQNRAQTEYVSTFSSK